MMEKESLEKSQHPEESQPSSPDSSAVEEPIILNKLFPQAEKDLDALFPDPSLKKLLKDIAHIRKKNERFLKNIHLNDLPPDDD